MKKIKLAVFDLEGTIFSNSHNGRIFPSLWAVLCNLCGPEAAQEDALNRDKFYAGKYAGYSEWVIDTLKIHQKYSLKQNQFESLINSIDYYPGVAETFDNLRQKGINIAIISGGLKALADRAAIDYKIEHCFAAAEYFWNQDGTIRHWNVMPTDFQHKSSLLSMLCHDLRINRNECAFIGDGRNDKDVAGFAGLSIGFNPHEDLREAASVIIEQGKGNENLSAVIQPLLKYPFFSPDDFAVGKIWQSETCKLLNSVPIGQLAATLSESGKRDAFHSFLVANGLTPKSANSYCSYMNNLCRNIAETGWGGASQTNAFTVLTKSAIESNSETGLISCLAAPLAGLCGRENDSTSAAKQFYRFINAN